MTDKAVSFTVFTPCYNRAHTIGRVYSSLMRQTIRDIEWIIIDDGSIDETGSIVDEWIKDGTIPIRYIKKSNGGKHTAFNAAIQIAIGDFFVVLDSDDWFSDTALERVLFHWNAIAPLERDKFAGIRCLSQYHNGKVIGNEFPKREIDGPIFLVNDLYKIRGDKCNFIRTCLVKKYPFPVFPGEKFCPEGVIWNRISQKYLFRHINESLQIVEYQSDGLSAKSVAIRMNSPEGASLYYREAFELPVSMGTRIKSLANFYRYRLHGGGRVIKYNKIRNFNLTAVFFCKVAGLFLFIRDKLKRT